jgi:hypothetical protein
MDKRSAMVVAAGLVLTLLVAGAAVATGFTGPDGSVSAPRLTPTGEAQQEPRVRTITRTVRVQRDAETPATGAPAPVVITQTAAPSTPSSVPSDDDAYEDEDHAYEDEDHAYEDDDHGEGDDD